VSLHEDPPARRDFHLALVGIVVPFAAFALTAALALKNMGTHGSGPGQAAWTRRLVGLAVLDFLVLLSLIALVAGKVSLPVPPAPPGPRIGVVLDPRDRGEGAEVLSVLPGSPAEQAGIQAGDTVTAIDGQPVTKNAEMTATIGATTPGSERGITLHRGDEEIEVRARPAPITTPPPRRGRLFESEGPGHPTRAAIARLGAAWGAAVGLLAVTALVAARRRASVDPPALGLWLAFAGTLAASNAALVGTTIAVSKVVGGSSLGGALVGVVAGSGVLLALSAAWRALLLRRGALAIEAEGAPAWRAVLGGVGYILAGLPRVGFLLVAAVPLFHLPETDPAAEIRELVRPGLGPAGIALFVFAAVILAPVGEETLFRGVLLPWLRRFLSPDAAAWASAGIFALGHLRYGPSVLVVLVYGLALAWARTCTGRLRAPIALHMVINAAAMGFTLLRR
jgi:membrane protease YdiL (CAAX protease family)